MSDENRATPGRSEPSDLRRGLLIAEGQLRGAVGDGSFRKDASGRIPSIRVRTVACGILAVTYGLLGGWLSQRLGTEGSGLLALVIIWAVALPLIPLPFMFGYEDLRFGAVSGRCSPEAAVRAFFLALRLRHYGYAYHCLLPAARQKRECKRDAIPAIGVQAERFELSDVRDFVRYWRPIIRPSSKGLSAGVSDVSLTRQKDDVAEVSCVISPGRAGAIWFPWHLWFCLFYRRWWPSEYSIRPGHVEMIRVSKVLRQVQGRWYLVSGELSGPEDGTFDEAVRVSELTDTEIGAAAAGNEPKEPK